MNKVSVHLLPITDHPNGTRRTSSLGGCCSLKGLRTLNGERNFVGAYLLPGPTNKVSVHLLPITDHSNDTRRTSSPGGCCRFRTGLGRLISRTGRLISQP
jgi:hypothetical protein